MILNGLSGFAQEKKKTIAVLEFASTGNLSKKEAITLTKRFRDMLVQTNTFKVLERDKMDAILKEQDFILSDDCNSAECAVQVGQLLGVEKMITGDIGNVGNTWTIGLRMIDMSSGEIERTETLDFQGAIDGMLEVMRQAAYVFAGLKIPKGKSMVYFKDNTLESAPTPSKPQGRFKFSIFYGPPWIKSMLNLNKWPDEHPNNEIILGGHLGGSIGYMITPNSKVSIEYNYFIYIQDTTATGYKNRIWQSHPSVNSLGINLSYYFASTSFKPYIQAGFGYCKFKEGRTDVDLDNISGIYISPAFGLDVRLFRYIDIQMVGRTNFMKPFSPFSVHCGVVFSMGNPFPETKK